MRILYQYIVSKITREDCRAVIGYLKSRIATNLPTDLVYKFITTSRPVEEWLEAIDRKIKKMARKKTDPELWVIIGGYGAGKSHMKEYVLELIRKIPQVDSVTIEVADLLQTDLASSSGVDNIYSVTLLQTIKNLDRLYNKLFGTQSSTEKIKEELRGYIPDDEFINVFCRYGEFGKNNESEIKHLRDLFIKKGSQLFFPVMNLYKTYLGINGFCIFVDEFEDLQHLNPEVRRNKFFESIRAFYDTLAKAYQNSNLPSFEIVILCTLSYWEELTKATLSQGLETRSKDFEIPQLIEDEIVTMAEKLYAIYRKAGRAYLRHELRLDFTKTPQFLARIAGIENPLTPRFVIKELIKLIEEPADYIGFTAQPQL